MTDEQHSPDESAVSDAAGSTSTPKEYVRVAAKPMSQPQAGDEPAAVIQRFLRRHPFSFRFLRVRRPLSRENRSTRYWAARRPDRVVSPISSRWQPPWPNAT